MPGRESDIREVHQDEEAEAADEDREQYEVLADILGVTDVVVDDPRALTVKQIVDKIEEEEGIRLAESTVRRRCALAVKEGRMRQVRVRTKDRYVHAWIILGPEQSQ